MRLYLHSDLVKSRGFRGGKYYTRVQTGWKSDGEPSYKYFYTAADYQKWKDGKKSEGGQKGDVELKRKVEHEHEEGTSYVQDHVDEKVPKKNETTSTDRSAKQDPKKRQELLYVRSH